MALLDSIPAQGKIGGAVLPELLLDLYNARFHGTLSLCRDRTEKTVRFHQGSPIHSESNLASESLGV